MLRARLALPFALSLLSSLGACSEDPQAAAGDGGMSTDGVEGDGASEGDGLSESDGESESDGRDGSAQDGTPSDGAGDGNDGTPSDGVDDGDGEDDREPPGPDDPADGPAQSALLTGVWNQDFAFDMASYPRSWAIATVHASMLYREAGIEYSPNAVLAIAIKETALSCANPNPDNAQETMAVKDGCFQIEAESAYLTLQQLFPTRFAAGHQTLISGPHFPSAALATVYYSLFSLARFREYRANPADPQRFFDEHPDRQAAQKVLCGAYNRGLWWPSLADIFASCRTREVTECFGGHAIAIDHASKIAAYTKVLDETTPFDVQLTERDLLDYWDSIAPFYPEVSDATAEAALKSAFARYRGDAATVSFHLRIRQILAALIAVLPALPTQDQAAAALCTQGQLSAANCP